MVCTQLRILRVFGLTSAEVTAILRQAQADGCTGLRLLERDGEFAVCVQASAPTQATAAMRPPIRSSPAVMASSVSCSPVTRSTPAAVLASICVSL